MQAAMNSKLVHHTNDTQTREYMDSAGLRPMLMYVDCGRRSPALRPKKKNSNVPWSTVQLWFPSLKAKEEK